MPVGTVLPFHGAVGASLTMLDLLFWNSWKFEVQLQQAKIPCSGRASHVVFLFTRSLAPIPLRFRHCLEAINSIVTEY